MEPKLKVTGLGWLCVWSRGEWIAVLQLTDEQQREYHDFLKADSASREQTK